MKSYFSDIFTREHLTTNQKIVSWWNKGRGLLNALFIICVLIHLSIVVLLFENGWILFLLPIIALVAIIINVLFSLGLVFELIALRVFKSKINFDKTAPEIKKWEFALSVLLMLILSCLDILNQ